MIGKTIGQYQVIDKIGEGGMGAVYKAEDTTLHRLVALKTLSSHLTEDAEAQERFVREAQSASSLNHPNITTVHEFIEDDDTRLICMEYVEGKTIRDMVESGVVSVRKAIDIIMQAAEALDVAHNKGILHRDVKSANIMVNMEGRVKVMDFGLAHLEEKSQLTRTGTTMGTLSYSSPEQISGRPVDRRSEIFSLGVVFYELLTGQLPFKASNEAEILFAIVNNEPPKVSRLRDDVPELVEAVVSRMLDKDSDLRYQTCADIISDLQGIRREMETSTVGITGVLQRVQTSRRKAVFQRVIAGITLVAAVVSGAILLTSGGPGLDPDRIVVAVFDNKTGNDELILEGERIANWVTQELLRAGTDVIPWPTAEPSYNAVSARIESGEITDPIRALAEETEAGLVLTGAIYGDGSDLRIESEITDAVTGKALVAFEPLVGQRDTFGEAIARFSSRVLGFFALDTDTRVVGSLRPPTLEAYQAFSEGWESYISTLGTGGLAQFFRAYELDPSFHQPLIYACLALWNQHRYAEEDSLLGILSQYREQLSRYHQLWCECLRALIDGDIEGSYSIMEAAAALNPGSKAVYNLAYQSLKTNRPRRALELFESLDPKRGPMRGWVPYWMYVADAYAFLEKYQKGLSAVRQGLEQYPDDPILCMYELLFLAALGNVREVNQLLDTRYTVPFDLSVFGSVGMTDWLNVANVYHFTHRSEAASEMIGRLLDWYESRPPGERMTLSNRSGYVNTLMLSDRWNEAGSILEESSAESPDNIHILTALGIYAARKGDQEKARSIITQLAGIHRPYLFGMNTFGQASIHAWLGEKAEAVRLLRTAYGQGMDYSIENYFNASLEPLWDYPAFQEFMKPRG
ncbi:protein kinase [Candidatus Zixiibacteriota bacterium]